MSKNTSKIILWAIYFALSLLLGFNIGVYCYRTYGTDMITPNLNLLRPDQNKINETLEVIAKYYVDSVDYHHLAESAVESVISELDPHSSYIPAADVTAANEDLEDSFSGIGIQFNMQTDTILVISVVSGGPSEKVGLLPFDRIITVDDSVVAGRNIGTNKVMRMLRGPKDSKVKLGIQRGNSEQLIDFELTRGDIPNYSVDVSYKVDDSIGYIKVSKFARSTYSEFLMAIAKLKENGAEGFIVDLRGNPGGYMEAAILMVNEFLSKGQLIVYMQGRAYSRHNTYSNGKGSCQDMPIVVLIDELSASASEIFSGAIQDNDRGLVIGRRSFGKGLVQNRFDLSDQSELLLTIARYYTPAGRCIQKEYELGKSEEYGQDIYNRIAHGEIYNADSIKMKDTLVFKTSSGRAVYGGGGIMPDLFVPGDTTGVTSYFSNIINTGILYRFILTYSDKNHDNLRRFATYQELYEYLRQQPLLQEFVDYATSNGIKKRPALIEISKNLIENQLHAYIIRNFFDNDGFYPIFMKDDTTLHKAIEVIKTNSWRPENEDNLKYVSMIRSASKDD